MPSDRTLASPVGAPKRLRRKVSKLAPLAVIAGAVVLLFPTATLAAPPVGLGTADSFAILAGSGITNTGPTTITGDVGTFPLATETGFGSVTLNGTNHGGDAVTQQAKDDLTTAYNVAAGSGPPASIPTGELGGLTLTPGVYNGATLQITGTLTLDTLGDPAAVFIFQTGSTLITASNSSVEVLGGGIACNVFWQVSSSATLGTDSHLIGSVLALTSISATTGATIDGRLLARNGAVTLDTNTVTAETCAASTTTTTPGATTTIAGAGSAAPAPGPGSPGSTATTNPSSETTSTGGGPTTTSTPDTVPPGLARTGLESRLALLGGLMVASGVVLAGASRVRRPQSTC